VTTSEDRPRRLFIGSCHYNDDPIREDVRDSLSLPKTNIQCAHQGEVVGQIDGLLDGKESPLKVIHISNSAVDTYWLVSSRLCFKA